MGQFKIRVHLRVRPSDRPSRHFHLEHKANGLPSMVRINLLKPASRNSKEQICFDFDSIIQGATQEAVFERCAAPAVTDVLNGYNGNIIAYGQVGSGKTFTMTGDTKPFVHSGLIPRCINRFFEEKESKPDADITVHVSYLEIYNDVVYDLLMKNQASSNLVVMEGKGVMEVKGLSRTLCRTEADAMKLFFEGERRRSVASHPLSRASSRSHTVFTIYVERHMGVKSLPERTAGRLNLVDLAGVERFRSSEQPDPLMREAMSINKSLTFLEQAVIELRKGQNHVSFRQSRLTALLRDAIVGNGKTVFIVCATPEDEYLDETISVCKFAKRLRELRTRAVVNKVLGDEYMERKYEKRVSELKQELALKDALCGRENISYDEMNDDLKAQLQACVQKFLSEGGNIKDMPVDSLSQVQEIFRIFKETQTSLQQELNKTQKELAASFETPAESPPALVDPNDGVGELDGQSFHVGEAPLDARPESQEVAVEPVTKDPDVEVASALRPPPTKEEPTADKKNAAFIHYKKHISEGQRFETLINERNVELRLKRKFAHETAAHINEAREEITDLSNLLGERSTRRVVFEENQALMEDERKQISHRLKIAKSEYRTAFEALKQVKREMEGLKQEIRDLKRDLLESFYNWFDTQTFF